MRPWRVEGGISSLDRLSFAQRVAESGLPPAVFGFGRIGVPNRLFDAPGWPRGASGFPPLGIDPAQPKHVRRRGHQRPARRIESRTRRLRPIATEGAAGGSVP